VSATSQPSRLAERLTRLSFKWRIFGAIAATVGLVLGGVLVVTDRFAASAAERAVTRALGGARYQARTMLAAREQAMRERAAVVVNNPTFRSLVESGAGTALQDQVEVAAPQIAARWVQVVGMDGIRLAKSDEPAADPVDLSGSSLIQQALAGAPAGALGIAGDTLLQVVAIPITGVQRQVGVLMAVRPLTMGLLDTLKAASGGDVEVVLYALSDSGETRVSASTIGLSDDVRAVVATHWRDTVPPAEPPSVAVHGTTYLAANEPLRLASGSLIGGLIILRDRQAEFGAFAPLRRSIAIGGVLGLVLAGILALLLAREMTRPIGALVAATRRAGEGDYAAEIPQDATGEVAILASAFRALLADLREKAALVEFLGASPTGVRPAMAAASGAGASPTGEMPQGSGVVALSVAPSAEMAVGARFAGRYEIKAQLGQGGMGVVYRALDLELGETVAIKVLRSEYLAGNSEALERFKSEIRLARRISHRNVVRTHDLGEIGGLYYITMEYAEGKILADLIRQRGALPPAIVLSVGKQLLRALEVAHEEGIIHRDIKPDNVLVQPDGVVKVMDFGIARRMEGSDGLTRANMVVGTPAYMAPEQLMGEALDARADLYSAGCVLYQCAVGRAPVELTSEGSLMRMLFAEPPAPPHVQVPGFPETLSAVIMRLMARERSERPGTAGEAVGLLEAVEK